MIFAGAGMLMCAMVLAAYYCREDQRAAESSERLLHELQVQFGTETVSEEAWERPAPEVFRRDADTKKTDERAGDTRTAEQHADTEEQRAELPAGLPEQALGILELPAWELALPVMDAYSEELLKQYPCRYGAEECRIGQMIIAGHNYKSHFRCLSGMQAGDEVLLTTTDGVRHAYAVLEITEISGDDREALFAGTWDLTLFTCAGYRKNRVVVRCRLKDNPI